MKKNLLCLIFLFPAILFAQNYDFKWIAQQQPSNLEIVGYYENQILLWHYEGANLIRLLGEGGIELWSYTHPINLVWNRAKIDSNGNVYFYGGDSEENIYITKLNNNGTELWTIQSQSVNTRDNYVSDLLIDNSGNVFLTGGFYADDISFGSITLTNTGSSYNFYLFKFDSSGNVEWGKNNDIGDDRILYLSNNEIFAANRGDGIYISKYNQSGNEIWSYSAGSLEDKNYIIKVLFDNAGNIFLIGRIESESVDFSGTIMHNSNLTNRFSDMYIAKLNSLGMLQFVNAYQVNTYRGLRGTALIDQNSNITISAIFCSETLSFDNITIPNLNYIPITDNGDHGSSTFLAQFDNNGNALWAKSIRTPTDLNVFTSTDSKDDFYLFGFIDDNGFTVDNTTLSYDGSTLSGMPLNGFMAKFSNNGAIEYVENFGNIALYYPYPIDDGFIITGYFEGNVNLDGFSLSTTEDMGLFIGKLYDTQQALNIPDANFKAYLLGNTLINTNSDTEIQLAEAEAFNGSIQIDNLGIASLSGIESFTAITELDCSNNSLSSIDLSKNTALSILYCNDNSLTSLDLSNNCSITKIVAFNNLFTSITYCNNTPPKKNSSEEGDENNGLTYIDCSNNKLTNLDFSTFSALTYLDCSNNLLSSLDLRNGNNSNMSYFDARNNPDLNQIAVDDVDYATANWTNIDTQTSFCNNYTTGLENIIDNVRFIISPNPSNGVITIEYNWDNKKDAHIEIINSRGVLVHKTIISSIKHVDLTQYGKGLYVVRLVTDNDIFIKKVIIK